MCSQVGNCGGAKHLLPLLCQGPVLIVLQASWHNIFAAYSLNMRCYLSCICVTPGQSMYTPKHFYRAMFQDNKRIFALYTSYFFPCRSHPKAWSPIIYRLASCYWILKHRLTQPPNCSRVEFEEILTPEQNPEHGILTIRLYSVLKTSNGYISWSWLF